MQATTFTIGKLTIENNYPAIDIVENFYASATERKTLFVVITVSKGVYTFVSAGENMTAEQNNVLDGICTNGTFSSKQAAAEAAFVLAVEMVTKIENDFAAGYPTIAVEAGLQEETAEVAEAFAYDSRRPYSHVQVCELAGLPLQASVYLHTYSSGDHEAGCPLGVAVKGEKDEYGFNSPSTYLGFVSNWRNAGMYAAALTTEYENAAILGNFKTSIEAQAALLRAVCDTIEAWAAAAHASLETEPTSTPENANMELEYEALSAGRVFDNAEPLPMFSLNYEMPANIYDLDELNNVIAYEEWRALGTIDAEINALKAKLIQLNDKRIGIIEECAHWRGKCDRAIEIAEYEANHEANEADADLRQSIWFATGQDII